MPVYYDKKRKTYYVSVYVEMKDGTKKRIMRRGFKTQRDAKKVEKELIFEYSQKSSDNPPFNEFIDEYIERFEKIRKKSSTRNLKWLTETYYKPAFENKCIQDIKNKDIIKLHDVLIDSLSVSTAKVAHGILSTVFNYAIKLEYINVNPCREVGNLQAEGKKEMNYWTLDEFKHFMSYVENEKYRALYMLLFYSGARVGELMALQWKDVDFKEGMIDINEGYYKGEIDTPKTKSSIRKIKIPNHTMKLLRELKLSRKNKDDYYVFGFNTVPMDSYAVWKKLKRDISIAGVKEIRVHDFRHSHASYLINKGCDIQIVSKRLGHTKVSTTLDVYSHLYPNKEDAAVFGMEDDFETADVIQLFK